jgi:hypothetical protein
LLVSVLLLSLQPATSTLKAAKHTTMKKILAFTWIALLALFPNSACLRLLEAARWYEVLTRVVESATTSQQLPFSNRCTKHVAGSDEGLVLTHANGLFLGRALRRAQGRATLENGDSLSVVPQEVV